MSYRGVEDVVDFDDDELNMARNIVEQAEAIREEDDGMRDRSFAEYREEDNDESDSEDGSHDEGSHPYYDADPQTTGMESPSSNVSNLGYAFYSEYNEGDDYESDSQDTSVRYPPSDASGSDEDMLASSEHSDSQENGDLDNELYELGRPPCPMSTDVESESDEDGRVLSPMNTDVEAEDIEMSETAVRQPVMSFNSEMSEIDAHPATSNELSETAAQPVPFVNLKSQISPFDNLQSSPPPQVAHTTPANPEFVISFGVDTSNLATLKPDTDMSEAPLQSAPPEAQDTKELQPEFKSALQCTTNEVSATDTALQTNQNTPIDVPADVEIEPAAVETSVASEIPSSSSQFHFDTKKSPTVASPALQSFDPSAWSNAFNFAPQEPAEEHQRAALTKEAGSSVKDECTEEKQLPENKPSPPSYKDAGTQADWERAAMDPSSPVAQVLHKILRRLEVLEASFAALESRNDTFNAYIEKLADESAAKMAELRVKQEERRAKRAKRRAYWDERRAYRDKVGAERQTQIQKREQELAASFEAFEARSQDHMFRMEAFGAKLDNYESPDFLSPRVREILYSPDTSEEDHRITEKATTTLAEWGASYEALQSKFEALNVKFDSLEL